jgi:hypothetical protein
VSTNKLRVLALMHRHLVPPEKIEEGTDITAAPWRTEYDVVSTLTGMGHEVKVLPVHDDLGDIRRASEEWKPHVAFNHSKASTTSSSARTSCRTSRLLTRHWATRGSAGATSRLSKKLLTITHSFP